MKYTCVICDRESDYAEGLMDYINKRKTLPFDAAACTSKESLIKYSKRTPIDILLISERIFDKEIENIHAEFVIVLDEGLGSDISTEYKIVYKYQACDALLRELMGIFSDERSRTPEFKNRKIKSKRIIGVYSPCGGCLKTTLALATGRIMAEKNKVLFADINAFSELQVLLDLPSGQGLSDLLYYFREGNTKVMAKLASIVCERDKMEVIPPLWSPEDLFGTSAISYRNLFETIMSKGVYDILVMDIGLPSFELMDICTKLYMPYNSSGTSDMKIKIFEDTLNAGRYSEIKDKVIKLAMPDIENGKNLNDYTNTEAVTAHVRHMLAMKGEINWE